MGMIKVFMILAFLDTGSSVRYQFDTVSNCKAAMPAVVQLYNDLGAKVEITCKEVKQ